MGATQLELSLVAAPDIKTVADLAGKTIALDALTTGFAFVLFDMLATAGLSRNDVEFVAVGVTPQRWQSVQEGVHAATLTIEPFTSLATFGGFNIVAKSTELYPEYQGGVIATTRVALSEAPDKAAAFIKAYLDGLDWVLDPANDADARTILSSRMPQIKPKAMDAVMKSLTSASGLTPHGAVLPKGMDQVIALRSNYGGGTAPLEPASTFMDLQIYQQIMKSRI